jgi:pyruvate/2-oxoglutarate dehydrogenase complex dihydrolipoamide dehydrogenase (E3) component
MAETQHVDVLVFRSGEAGKYVAWTMAKAGFTTAVVERKLIGGFCPNIACLPSKNIIHSAKVAELHRRGPEFGFGPGPSASLGVVVADARVEGIGDHQHGLPRAVVPGPRKARAPVMADQGLAAL